MQKSLGIDDIYYFYYKCSQPLVYQGFRKLLNKIFKWNIIKISRFQFFENIDRSAKKRVSILPMRDWNKSAFTSLLACSSVSILPMRDWNSYISLIMLSTVLCFYLTYEGLKHNFLFFHINFHSSFLSYLWGIETPVCGTFFCV